MSHFRTLALRRTVRASTLDRLQMWLCEAVPHVQDLAQRQDLDRGTAIVIRETDVAITPPIAQRFSLVLAPQFCVVVCGEPRRINRDAVGETFSVFSREPEVSEASEDASSCAQSVFSPESGSSESGSPAPRTAHPPEFYFNVLEDPSNEYYEIQLAFDHKAIQAFLLEANSLDALQNEGDSSPVNPSDHGYFLPNSLRTQAITQLHEYTDQHPCFERAILDLIVAWETECESRELVDQLQSRQEFDHTVNPETTASLTVRPDSMTIRIEGRPIGSVDPGSAESVSADSVNSVSSASPHATKSPNSSSVAESLTTEQKTTEPESNAPETPAPIATLPSTAVPEAENPTTENPTTEHEPTDIVLVDILRDTISRALAFLQLDRLAIYQFSRNPETPSPADYPNSQNDPQHGSIVYEALATPEIGSLKEPEILVHDLLPRWVSLDPREAIVTINDVQAESRLVATEVAAMVTAQVCSQVIVPLRLRDQLWGVLLAQQCTYTRSWSQHDCEFLRYVAADMSLAIQQAEAVAELQHQKYIIEQTVEQQMHQLNDARLTTQTAQQTRTEFLSMMSHELRTPLACIIGMSSTLLRWSFGHLNDKQREYLKTIYDSGEHLLGLIDDLLDLTQLESGATQLKLTEFSLSQLARHIIRTAIDRATVNGIQLDLKLDIPANLDQFRADRARVNQILFNLLGNALKFTLTGGRVVLSVTRDDRQVIFSIQDTGIGISPSQQESLFESFRQVDGTYTREYGGTGLGLTLTKQLVDLHNGTIEVQSEPDIGSCFTVCLPQANEPVVVDTPIPALRSMTHIPQGHIVLVTRREDDATLICDVLTAAGLQVIWMLDGSTALEQIRVLHPIVAIVDRRLDGIDGVELTSILRQSHDTAELRIVMIGNGAQCDDEALCLNSGADRCITIPLNLEQLLAQVIELIELDDEITTTPNLV